MSNFNLLARDIPSHPQSLSEIGEDSDTLKIVTTKEMVSKGSKVGYWDMLKTFHAICIYVVQNVSRSYLLKIKYVSVLLLL